MTETRVHDIDVDVCQDGCGGLWFDWLELKKVDEKHEAVGADLLDVKRDETVEVDHAASRECPRCEGIIMMRHYSSVKREIQVDECAKCGGYFLDYGELNQLRDQFENDEERAEAAHELFAEMFDDELEDLQAESEEDVERARGLARIFRFLLPSYYLPGKQKWGSY
jgi:Zn-finger nucleic acid-binding protein